MNNNEEQNDRFVLNLDDVVIYDENGKKIDKTNLKEYFEKEKQNIPDDDTEIL